jgi:transposase
MRKSFEGLYGLVRDRLGLEPVSGHLFLFCNKARNRIKVLVWDGSGLWVCAKRLEKGRFSWPSEREEQARVMLTHEELSLLLGGIELSKTRRKTGIEEWKKLLKMQEKGLVTNTEFLLVMSPS